MRDRHPTLLVIEPIVLCNHVFLFNFNRENRAKGGGICVANHTSPIDIILLGCDNAYAMVSR